MRKLLATLVLVCAFAAVSFAGTTEIPPAPGTTEIPPAASSEPSGGTTEIPPSPGTTEIPPLASASFDLVTIFFTVFG